ncbi:MAG: hypothetical protein MJ175_08985 [Clostridia bacterium]|nr:hypothetical protein [Clostridia bacterium]
MTKKNFTFDGPMSREVLNNYLSRAVTHIGIGYDNNRCSETFEDDLRMLKNEGAKFIGRASYVWADSVPDPEHFAFAKARFARGHEVDPEFIFQACVFECIYRPFVEATKIPAYVFEAFDLPAEDRNFSFDAMRFTDKPDDVWGMKQTGVPDITKEEAQLWFFYRSAEYILAGAEAIHLGQVCMIGRDDKDFACWHKVIDKIRAFGSVHARRHYVLIDAHTLGWLRQDETMFDYNAFPIRLKEIPEEHLHCVCEEGYLDSMFNEKDGLCRPFLVEFDNFGISPTPGEATVDSHYAWGYDEISWFAKLPADYRAEFLPYIRKWVNDRYPEGWVQMPSHRCLTGCDRYDYSANTHSDACPHGWSDEETIKAIFETE